MASEQGWTEDWHKEQIKAYNPQRDAYALYARLLGAMLDGACEALTSGGRAESRAKAITSFAEKTIRKYPKHTDPIHEFTDLCGARAVAYLQEEAERICRFVRDAFTIDEDNSQDVLVRLGADQFGYRSIHYIVQMPWVELLGLAMLDAASTEAGSRIGDRAADQVFGTVFGKKSDEELIDWLGQVMPTLGLCVLRKAMGRVLADSEVSCTNWADVICTIANRKAEIQVQTVLQNVWATISHDRLYKNEFTPPLKLQRQLNRLAALLEDADEDFGSAATAVDEYRLEYGAYMTADRRRAEIGKLAAVLPYAEGAEEVRLAHKIGQLAISLADWDLAIELLERYRCAKDAGVLRDLGYAECRKGRCGQVDLRRATELDPNDAVASYLLGDIYCEMTDMCCRVHCAPSREMCVEAERHYAKSFELAPTDPGVLSRHLECSMCSRGELDLLPLLRPELEAARDTSLRRMEVRVHIPETLYDLGEFELLLGRPYESLSAYAKAVYLSDTERPIEDAVKSLQKIRRGLEHVTSQTALPGWAHDLDQMLCFLQLARAGKLRQLLRLCKRDVQQAEEDLRKAEEALKAKADAAEPTGDAETLVAEAERDLRTARSALTAAKDHAKKAREEFLSREGRHWEPLPKEPPIVIVAGGSDPRFEHLVQPHSKMIVGAFEGYKGTVISAGTMTGVGRVIGDVQERYGEKIHTVFYIPDFDDESRPKDVELDGRYKDKRTLPGKRFSIFDPLQTWIDIIGSEIEPHDVKVLGINGGQIAGAEYRIALALDACVAVLEESGREAAKLLPDEDWGTSERLLLLPGEQMVVAAYLAAENVVLPEELAPHREQGGRDVHETYLTARRKELLGSDPAASEWGELAASLRESSCQQFAHIFEKLRLIGWTWDEEKEKREVAALAFWPGEVEMMAEAEHARYLIERFLDGWKWGEKKDVANKINPALVGWEQLSDDTKEYDRTAVKEIPKILKGFHIQLRDPDREERERNEEEYQDRYKLRSEEPGQ